MKLRFFLFAALLVFSLSTTVEAAIRVQKASAGIGGFVRPERWVPVTLSLFNNGGDFRGTVQVLRGKTIFRKSLHLAAGSEKRVEIIYYHSAYFEPVSYQIIDSAGRLVAEDAMNVSILNYQDNLVLVLSESEYNHQFLSGQPNPWGGKTFVTYMRPSDLSSEWLYYTGADVLALGSLSPDQLQPSVWRAMMQAVASGGVLVCSAGTSQAILKDPLLSQNLPRISPYLDRTSRADFLMSRWAGASTEPFPELSLPTQTVYKRVCDRELIPLNGSSLVTASPYYKGSIIYWAFDYTRVPELVRPLFASAWNETIHPASTSAPPAFSQPFRKRLEENPRIQKLLWNIPGLHLPDIKWFALFFFVYICAIGPAQYALLRMVRKTSYLWITFPAIILSFTLASFGYSKFRHSTERRITQAAVIEVFPELQQQTVWQVYGTTLTKSGTFNFQAVPENSYLRKFVFQSFSYLPEPFVLSEDLPRQIVGERIKTWTFRTFDAISVQPQSAPVSVSVQSDGRRLWGEVRNSGETSVTSSFFAYDNRNAANIGPIEPGEKRAFHLELNNRTSIPFAESHLRDLLHLYSVSYSFPHFLLAEFKDAPGSFVVNGNKESTQCTMYVAVFANVREAGMINRWLSR